MIKRIVVVVVAYNSGAVLGKCISALRASAQRAADVAKLERIIVVDNASVEPVTSTDPLISIRRLTRNVGFAPAVNVALTMSGACDYILLLNPDAYLYPDALESLVRKAIETDAALVGPVLVAPDGNPHGYSERSFHSLHKELLLQLFGWRPRRYAGRRAVSTGRARCLTGACLLVDNQLVKMTGGLDDAIPMYLEDVELCAAAHQLRRNVILDTAARCEHSLGGSSGGVNFERSLTLHLMLLSARVEFVRRRSSVRGYVMRGAIGIGALLRICLALVAPRRTLARHVAVARWAFRSGLPPTWTFG